MGYSKRTLKGLSLQATTRFNNSSKHSKDDDYKFKAFATFTYTGIRSKTLASNIKKHWSTTADPRTKLLLTFRTLPNLKKTLVRSKAPKQPTSNSNF
jgi:hypothetical protein